MSEMSKFRLYHSERQGAGDVGQRLAAGTWRHVAHFRSPACRPSTALHVASPLPALPPATSKDGYRERLRQAEIVPATHQRTQTQVIDLRRRSSTAGHELAASAQAA